MGRKVIMLTAVMSFFLMLTATSSFAELTPSQKSVQNRIDTQVKREIGNLNRGEINISKYGVISNVWTMQGFTSRYPEYFFVDEYITRYKELPNGASRQAQDNRYRLIDQGKWPVDSVLFRYTMTNAQIKTYSPMVHAKANQIVAKARKEKTTRERIAVVNNELKKIITYSNTTAHCYSTYGAFIMKKAHCEGYSKAFYLCMKKLGIPCEYVHGIVRQTGGGHVWNAVTLNETKYKYVTTPYKATVYKKVNGKTVKTIATKYKTVKTPYIVKTKYFVDVTWNDTGNTNKYLLIRSRPEMKIVYSSRDR